MRSRYAFQGPCSTLPALGAGRRKRALDLADRQTLLEQTEYSVDDFDLGRAVEPVAAQACAAA